MTTQTSVPVQHYRMRWIALLGLLTALGPLSIDMYLPALTSMAQDFGTSTKSISNSIPAYFLGLAIGQLIYGGLSDRIGRKRPMYIGLVIYTFASFLCALAPTENTLIIARFLQALGGCVGVVMARAAIRDSFDSSVTVQALSHMAMILGLAPIVAPLIGSGLMLFFTWHSIFILLGIIGGLTLLCVHYGFTETLPAERRVKLNFAQNIIIFAQVLADSSFRTPMLAMSFFSGLLFCYITSASSLLMAHFHLNQLQFATVFAINSLGIMMFSFINNKLIHRVGSLAMLQFGATLQLIGAGIIATMSLHSPENLPIILVGLFLVVANIGLTGPNATALALAQQKQRAGVASALLGSIQFAVGLLAGVVLYHLKGSILQNIAYTMLMFSIIGIVCVYVMRIRMRLMRKAKL